MRFVKNHPVVIFFLIVVAGLSYAVTDKLELFSASSVAQTGPGAARGRATTTNVIVTPVTRQTVADLVESVATASANESVNITPKLSETVSRVHFEDGDQVEQGDVLVELTNLSEASRLAEAQASVGEAERQYQRLQNLSDTNLISRTDLDAARTAAETAAARLEGVMVAMDDRLIRAPFSGVLGFRNVSEGTLVTPGTVITTLDDLSTIKLDFNIAEVYLADMELGLQVKAKSIVYPGKEFDGIVQVVGSRIDPVTRSVAIRAFINNDELLLRPGMLLTVSMGLNEYVATVVPEQAVVPRMGRQFVYVVDTSGTAREVEVMLGRRRPGIVEIVEGVSPGQLVVTQGVESIRPGQPVNILETQVIEPLLDAADNAAASD